MKRNVVSVALIALCAFVAFGEDKKPAAPADPVVLRVGTSEIRQSEFEAALASLPEEYQMYVQQQGKRAFADDFVRMRLLAQDAIASKLDKDPKVAAQLALVRENTLAAAMLQRIEDGTVPTDAQIGALYEAKKGSLETVDARHILVAFAGSPAAKPETTLTEEQAKAKAESLKAKIAGGADFAELAKTESDDTFSGQQGGSLGSFGRGQMVPEFEQAAFSFEVGKVGEVVKTQFGFHVIEVTRRGAPPVDEVRESLTEEVRNTMVQQKVTELTGKTKIVLEDAYFGPAAPEAPKPE